MEPQPADEDRRAAVVPITPIPIGETPGTGPASGPAGSGAEEGTPGADASGAAPEPDVHPPAGEAPPLPPSFAMLLERAVRIAIGVTADLVVGGLTALRHATPGIPPEPEEIDDGRPVPEEPGIVPLFIGAGFGLAVEATRRAADAAASLVKAAGPLLSFPLGSRPVRGVGAAARERLEELDRAWRDAQPSDREAADAFVSALLPEIVRGLLRKMDLTGLIVENVDIDRVIAAVDLDQVVARIDVDDLVGRVDMDAIVQRVDVDAIVRRLDVDAIVQRVDVDGVVAGVDIDRVVSGVDVEAVVRRIDVVSIARSVIEELDVPALVRDSSATMATETVGGIRVQAVNADRAVSKAVDRLLRRTRPSDEPGERPEP